MYDLCIPIKKKKKHTNSLFGIVLKTTKNLKNSLIELWREAIRHLVLKFITLFLFSIFGASQNKIGISFQWHCSIRCATYFCSFACCTSPMHQTKDIYNRVLRYHIPFLIEISSERCIGDLYGMHTSQRRSNILLNTVTLKTDPCLVLRRVKTYWMI